MLPRYSIADAIRAHIERLVHQPSSTVWLRGIRLKTDQFDQALDFYSNLLGLPLHEVTIDPKTDRPRAHFIDAIGDEILLIEETVPDEASTGLEIAFSMPQRVWYLFRSRLETRGYDYESVGDTLYLKDINGTIIRVKALDETSFQASDLFQ